MVGWYGLNDLHRDSGYGLSLGSPEGARHSNQWFDCVPVWVGPCSAIWKQLWGCLVSVYLG